MAPLKQKKVLWILMLFVFILTGSNVYGKIDLTPILEKNLDDILLSGLPFKGPFDAPVTIAVFDDYQ